MTTSEELAKEIRQLIESYQKDKKTYWKFTTKYYKGEEKEPYYETSEGSSGQ